MNELQNIGNITLEELDLFLLPKNFGNLSGRRSRSEQRSFSGLVRNGSVFVSLPKGENPLDVTIVRAQELIDEKAKADAPIATSKGQPVQKGTGRFGPFIKWDRIFINVSKKYNFDNLSQSDIVESLKTKFKKISTKVLHNWTEEGILVEKSPLGKIGNYQRKNQD